MDSRFETSRKVPDLFVRTRRTVNFYVHPDDFFVGCYMNKKVSIAEDRQQKKIDLYAVGNFSILNKTKSSRAVFRSNFSEMRSCYYDSRTDLLHRM